MALDAGSGGGAPRVVVVGGGFGGAYLARELERELRRDEVELIVVDRHNHFVFTPLLVEAGTGGVEPRHAVVSLRRFVRRCRVLMAEVTDVDPEGAAIHYRLDGDGSDHTLSYDHLVLAPGSVTRMPPVDGLAEHGFEIKSLADAVDLRDRAIQLLELADATADPERQQELLHFVVVGGNYTGVEVAGEFHELLRTGARSYPHVDAGVVRTTLIELTDRILPALDRGLADYAADQLRRRGVEIRLEETVERVEPDQVALRGGGTLRTHTVIWAAGIAPSPLNERSGLPTDERGYLRCGADMRVEGQDRVWAIGDAAVNPDPDGDPYPPTAQHATRQGQALARNLVAVVRGREPRPRAIPDLGSLVMLGHRRAVAEVLGVRLSGFLAWWLYRTVYLSKMPGLGRKVRVALDWTLDLLSRPDLVQLGIGRGARRPGPVAVDGQERGRRR